MVRERDGHHPPNLDNDLEIKRDRLELGFGRIDMLGWKLDKGFGRVISVKNFFFLNDSEAS